MEAVIAPSTVLHLSHQRNLSSITHEEHQSTSQRKRIALYSHDTMGLGHMRRNMLIARALAAPPFNAIVLMVSGTHEANAFGVPPGVDCLTLPALFKEGSGKYRSRCMDVSLQELISIRANAIKSTLETFQPDVLIVDNVPRGAVRELDPTLESLRARGTTRFVLGLRDVLDDPIVVRSEWERAGNEQAIRRYYGAIWVYGDPNVYDMVNEYGFATDIVEKMSYTGYLNRKQLLSASDEANALTELNLPDGEIALCCVGGGQDGDQLAEAFAKTDFPANTTGIIVTGPFMSDEVRLRLTKAAEGNPQLRILKFVKNPELLMERANHVVAMGGYNTVCEVLSYEKHALIVPRVNLRREQIIRAERLRDMGLLDMLLPTELSPRALTSWIAGNTSKRIGGRKRVDLNGLVRMPHLLEEMFDVQRQATYATKTN